jgi:hypothetical protein
VKTGLGIWYNINLNPFHNICKNFRAFTYLWLDACLLMWWAYPHNHMLKFACVTIIFWKLNQIAPHNQNDAFVLCWCNFIKMGTNYHPLNKKITFIKIVHFIFKFSQTHLKPNVQNINTLFSFLFIFILCIRMCPFTSHHQNNHI